MLQTLHDIINAIYYCLNLLFGLCKYIYFDIFSDKMKTEDLEDEDLIEMEFDSEMNEKVVRFYK